MRSKTFKRSSSRNPAGASPRFRLFLAGLVGLLLCGSVLAADLRVHFFDCGQGDSALVLAPSGRAFLIDAGPDDRLHGGTFDAGEDVILPYLRSHRILALQAVVLTHPHLDHYGGALAVTAQWPVREVIDPGWPVSAPPYLQLLRILEQRHIAYRNVREGDRLEWDPALTVEVFGPREKIYARSVKKENPNNRSVVLKITYGHVSFLFPGDAERQAESYLVRKFGGRLRATVLKAPHHGSKTSSTAAFLRAVRPEVTVISCGRGNRYGHPHPGTLARLGRIGTKIYRTDLDGSVDITTDGRTYRVETGLK